MTETPWLNPTEARAWRALRQFRTPLATALNRQLLRDSALSSADYEVLVVLSETDSGALRAGELGRETGWEKSRLSHHLKRMEARRLVERRDCLTDGRGLLVAITEHGRRAIEEAAPGHVRAVRQYVIDLLTPAQLQMLAEVGEAIGARLEAENCRAAGEDMALDGSAGVDGDARSAQPAVADRAGGSAGVDGDARSAQPAVAGRATGSALSVQSDPVPEEPAGSGRR